MNLDGIDLRILDIIQSDASLSLTDVAGQVNLSANACWRRIRQLEESGVVLKRVTLLDPAKLGVAVAAYVLVRAAEHSEQWYRKFAETVASIPDVVEFCRTSGDIDYLLKIRVPDVRRYDEIYKLLVHSANCADVSAAFCMEEIKCTTAIPLDRRSPHESAIGRRRAPRHRFS